jgi:pyruvate/2-oxoglutarate/acetoin dehydrogenase E1 component
VSSLNLVEAINAALHAELARDERVLVLGEDVGLTGGVFRATLGLLDRFGPDRVLDTPLAESGYIGAAIGMAMGGLKPVPEVQFDAYVYPALEQVFDHMARYRWRTAGAMPMDMTLRIPFGGGNRAPEHHSDSPRCCSATCRGYASSAPHGRPTPAG